MNLELDQISVSDPERCQRLHYGLHDQADPVTWRTLLYEAGQLLGVSDPQWQHVPEGQTGNAYHLLTALTEGTLWRPLVPEMMLGLGLPSPEPPKPLDTLVVSARRFGPDPLFWSLGEEGQRQGQTVAGLNPVGNYSDGQPRIAGLAELLRPVQDVLFVGSTQAADGGSMTVMEIVTRLLRNPQFSQQVKRANIVLPMIGGSRGHRLGQRGDMVYEVLEMIANPKALGLPLKDVLRELQKEQIVEGFKKANPMGVVQALLKTTIPEARVITVDIHNDELPGKVFERMGIEFVSADPSPEFADAIYAYLEDEALLDKPLMVVACDKGAVMRAEGVAHRLLHHPKNSLRRVDVLYLDKVRTQAGIIDNVSLAKRTKWMKQPDGSIVTANAVVPSSDDKEEEEFVIIFTDDMADTCGTAKNDGGLVLGCFQHVSRSMFVFTHPVLSRGPEVLDTVPVDRFLFGNTLSKGPELTEKPDVQMVDMAPSILRGILGV